jgi:sensor histidine kinase YesM
MSAVDLPVTPMMAPASSKTLSDDALYWLCQIAGWGVTVGFNGWANWRVTSIPLNASVANAITQMVLYIGATHALRAYSKKHHWTLLGARTLLMMLLMSSVVLAIAVVAANVSIDAVLSSFGLEFLPPRTTLGLSVALLFAQAQLFLLLWMAFYFSFALLQQRQTASGEEARLRASLRTAELSLLKSQLNPHFLFNALNTVRALISESPQRAELAVTQLARTLRYALNSSRDELVSVQNELTIVEDYLGIETLRMAERLKIVKEIAANSSAAQIPIMLLQTLVENAVKHGISQLPQGGLLKIATKMEDGTLVIEVQNDRPLIKSTSIPSDRVGLANANERLRLMIGPGASLKLDLSHPERAIATVRIPQKSVNSE